MYIILQTLVHECSAYSYLQLWNELCELISENPEKVKSLKVEAIIRQGIKRYSDQVWILCLVLSINKFSLGSFTTIFVPPFGLPTYHVVLTIFSVLYTYCHLLHPINSVTCFQSYAMCMHVHTQRRMYNIALFVARSACCGTHWPTITFVAVTLRRHVIYLKRP